MASPPGRLRTQLIWEVRRQATGVQVQMLARMKLRWFWPGMAAEVQHLLSTCEVCQMAKVRGIQETQGRRRLYAGRPWQRIAIDIVGSMPVTPLGNRWILVFTGHFTRLQDVLSLPDATMPMMAAALEERVICYFGIPEIIQSDQECNSSRR